MKRVLAFFSSPTKQEKIVKRPKTTASSPGADTLAHLDSVERLQSQLLDLDVQCSAEQLQIQRRYDALRLPLLVQRQKDIAEIPNFWFLAMANHPAMDPQVFDSVDSGPLYFLADVWLDDNLDDCGSYKLTFTFASDNPYFSETRIERKEKFSSNLAPDEISLDPPTISWAPAMKPSLPAGSFFAWLTNETASDDGGVDFGEIFRRDLWQNPFAYFCNLSTTAKSSPESVEVRTRLPSDEE